METINQGAEMKEGDLLEVHAANDYAPVGSVWRAISINLCGHALFKIDGKPIWLSSHTIRPYKPTADQDGWIDWVKGDCPLEDGDKCLLEFKEGINFNSPKDWQRCHDEDIDWNHSRKSQGYMVTRYKPLGAARERLLGPDVLDVQENSVPAIEVGDWVRTLKDQYALPIGTVAEVVKIDNDGDIWTESTRSGNCYHPYKLELYATAAEHETYQRAIAPEGWVKLPFNEGGWKWPEEGDRWIGGGGHVCSNLTISPPDGKQVIVEMVTAKELKRAVAEPTDREIYDSTEIPTELKHDGQWIKHTGDKQPVGDDVLVQYKLWGEVFIGDGDKHPWILKASVLVWSYHTAITHYRTLPQPPEGYEHTGEFRRPLTGEPFTKKRKGDWAVAYAAFDFDNNEYWILKPLTKPVATTNLTNEKTMSKTEREIYDEAPEVFGLEKVPFDDNGYRVPKWREIAFWSNGTVAKARPLWSRVGYAGVWRKRETKHVIYRKKPTKLGTALKIATWPVVWPLKRIAKDVGAVALIAGLATGGIALASRVVEINTVGDMVRELVEKL